MKKIAPIFLCLAAVIAWIAIRNTAKPPAPEKPAQGTADASPHATTSSVTPMAFQTPPSRPEGTSVPGPSQHPLPPEPHPDTPPDPDRFTHQAVSSGLWSDPKIWADGRVPGEGARVRIPAGVALELEGQTSHLKRLRIDGALSLSTKDSSHLTVDQLHLSPTGAFTAGTAKEPIPADVDALVSILPYLDPNQPAEAVRQSALFIAEGQVSVHGQEKTASAFLTEPVKTGDTVLNLGEAPVNWTPGDLLVVAGSGLSKDDTETLRIVKVEGTRVTVEDAARQAGAPWEGLRADYAPGSDRLNFAVNLTRNVAFNSQPPTESETLAQGALVLRGEAAASAQLANFAAYGLGMSEGNEDGLGTAMTRDAITIENTGATPVRITGMVVVDAPANALLQVDNARVQVANSAAFNAQGAAWITPGGDPNYAMWSAQRSIPPAASALRPGLP